MIKTIFLDIDGVLNNADTIREHKRRSIEGEERGREFCEYSVNALNEIIKQTDAKIVISSSWRWVHETHYLRELFKKEGIIGEIIDATPKWTYYDTGNVKGQYNYRGEEIQAWLDKNPVDGFVIIDDTTEMCHLINKLVKTRFSIGLTDEHVKPVVDQLNGMNGSLTIPS